MGFLGCNRCGSESLMTAMAMLSGDYSVSWSDSRNIANKFERAIALLGTIDQSSDDDRDLR
jgi:hypothetical protein